MHDDPIFWRRKNASRQSVKLENERKKKKHEESKKEKQPLLLLRYCAILKILYCNYISG